LRGPVLPRVVAAPALPTWGRGPSTICTGHYVIFGDVWIEDWIVLGTGNERMKAVKSKGSKK
ncbi:hypothetical protein ACLBV4_34430, partial [Pseudomonas aeruginosa]